MRVYSRCPDDPTADIVPLADAAARGTRCQAALGALEPRAARARALKETNLPTGDRQQMRERVVCLRRNALYSVRSLSGDR